MKTKLLIDADYFLYRSANAAEEEHEYDHDFCVIVGNFKRGKQIFEQEIKVLTKRFDSDDILLTFTDGYNFRKDVDPDYKGHRVRRKPCGYRRLKDWACSTWDSRSTYGLEADDVLGIAATSGEFNNFVLISPDKDMEQIPCRLYNLKEEFTQTPEAAERKLWMQTLTGDSTDGYQGIPGIGPKKAEQILDKIEDSYADTVLQAYLENGQTEEDFYRNLRLARILQASDIDPDTNTVILYEPFQ
jgi:5'-3' exonuclease